MEMRTGTWKVLIELIWPWNSKGGLEKEVLKQTIAIPGADLTLKK